MPAPGTLPQHAKEIWDAAYAAAKKQYPDDPERQHKVAWAAIKKAGYSQDGEGKWHKTTEAQVENALVELSIFGAGVQPTVASLTEAEVTVDAAGKTWRVPYTAKSGSYVFGKPVETDPPKPEPFKGVREAEYVPLELVESEAIPADWDNGKWPVVIIEAKENQVKQREYTNAAIKTAEAESYVGLPMYIDHAGKEGAPSQPRSLRDMAGKVLKAWHGVSEAGREQIRGLVHIFDPWLKERGRDPEFRSMVGLSHVADGAGHRERRGGKMWQVVEAITSPISVDFVSKAAFGGRLAESELDKRAEDLMALETLTEADLVNARPDLVEKMSQSAVERYRLQENESDVVKQATTEAETAKREAAAAKAELRETKLRVSVAEAVADPQHKIPESVRPGAVERVVATLKGQEIAPDKFKETVTEAVKAEGEYLAKATPRPTPRLETSRSSGSADAKPEPTELEKLTDQLIG